MLAAVSAMARKGPGERYKGFLSYSHAADGTLAPKLQSALHQFAKPWHRLRAVRIFRDKTSLSADPALWPSIETALRSSEFLLLMASPDAAQSRWVAKELDTFLNLSGSERVLVVLTEGELVWNHTRGDFNWTSTTAFPQLGRKIFEAEPLWVDLRAIRTSRDVSVRNPDFRDGVARLSSALRGIPLDQLIGEDIRQHRKTLRLAWSAVLLLTILAVALALSGTYSMRKGAEAQAAAKRARNEALVSWAGTLEPNDPLTAALVLSELDSDTPSDRAFVLARRVANELPVAVWKGSRPKWTPDGQRVLTVDGNGIVRVWRTDALNEPIVLKGHTDSVSDVAIDDRGQLVAVACSDQSVTVWSADGSGQPVILKSYQPKYAVIDNTTVAFSPLGDKLVFINGATARLAKADAQGEPIILAGHGDTLVSVAWSPDGRRLATTSLDRTTRVWNVAAGAQPPVVLGMNKSYSTSVEFSGDGRSVLTQADDGTVRVYRSDGQGSPIVYNSLDYTPYSVAFNSDGTWISSGSKEGAVLYWKVDQPERPNVLRGHTGWVRSALFAADSRHIVSASDDGTARVWGFEGGDREVVLKVRQGGVDTAFFSVDRGRVITSGGGRTQVWSPDGNEGEAVVLPHGGHVNSIAFSPNGKRVVTASDDGTARVWDMGRSSSPLILRGHSAALVSASFSPDNSRVLTASKDGTARVWAANASGDPAVLQPDSGPLSGAAFNRDGTRVVTASKAAMVWSLDHPFNPVTLGDQSGRVDFAEFSSDGSRVLVASRKSALVWNADGHGSPVELKVEDTAGIMTARFSPDGTHVILTSGRDAFIWQADGKGEPRSFEIPASTRDAFISPDRQHLLVLGFAFGVYVWKADGQGDPLHLDLTDGYLTLARFSPDGERIAAATSFHTVLVWKAGGPSEPLLLAGHQAMLTGVAVSPDGAMVATSSYDGTARLWSIDPQKLMKYVVRRAAQVRVCLTAEQRMQYFGEQANLAQSHFLACESRSARGTSQ